MKAKAMTTMMITLFLASIITALPASAGYGTPTIDGVIDEGEWGEPTFSNHYDGDLLYNIYVLNDEDFLYVAFEAGGGDFTIASSMTNIYIYGGTDYAGECWAYCVAGWVGVTELVHFTIHHIQPPKVKEGREVWSTVAVVDIEPTVMEWKIPLGELPMILGELIAFDFMSFSEGWSNIHGSWSAAWLYEQYYTLAPPPQIWFKASGGGVSESDVTGTYDNYCTLGVIGMSLESSTGMGDRVPCKGSGTFIDHDMKLKISFNIEEGAIVRADNLIYFWGTASVFDIYNHEKAYDVPFRLGLVDGEYGTTNRFDVQCYGYYWHGTLLPEGEVTVWVWST
jgi:hypothetical protein